MFFSPSSCFLFVLLIGVCNAQYLPCETFEIDSDNACNVACNNNGYYRTMELNNATHLIFIRSCACGQDLFCLDQVVEQEIFEFADALEDQAGLKLGTCSRLGVDSDGMCSHVCDMTFPSNTGYATHMRDGLFKQLLSCRCSLTWENEPITICVDREGHFDESSATSSIAAISTALLLVLSITLFM